MGSSLAPLAALALLGAASASSACSVQIGALPPPEAPPVPLAIAGPHDELVYTHADDEDPALPGIQLVVRVDVDDERIDVVDLAVAGALVRDFVAEDLACRRAAFFDVTLAGADTPLRARAEAPGPEPLTALVEVEALLRAIQ